MSEWLSACAAEVIKRGNIRATDVSRLRKILTEGVPATAAEADALFSIRDACPVYDPAWSDLFIEAITGFIVRVHEPSGYLTQAKAEWLTRRLARTGEAVSGATDLDLLIAVLERARWSPVSLVQFALAQVEYAVRHGAGPLRAASPLPAGTIGAAEISLARRILCAHGGDEPVAITQGEAQSLFAIDEAASGGPPDPAWTDLFVKAMTNAVMASSGHAVPTRREALRWEPWPNLWRDPWPGVFPLRSVFPTSTMALEKYPKQSAEERLLSRLERQRIEIITDEPAAVADVGWLARRLGPKERASASEQMLLTALRQAHPTLHPLLQTIVEQDAEAA